jgi:murein DD-endopeptidase MepM/ murein hydrolase activator NlpD
MAKADPKNPDTAVRVEPGDTLSAIARANGLTLSEIRALNPALMNDPKYNNGSTIFSNTKVNIAPPATKTTTFQPDTTYKPNPEDDRQAAIDRANAEKGRNDSAAAAAERERLAAEAERARLAAEAAEAARLAALSANAGGGNATPYYAPYVPNPTPPSIKTATPQFVLFNDDEIPVDAIVDLLFENIGGQELLMITRADTVNGQKILYQPIKNLNILRDQYNPNNIVRLQNTSDKFFSNFSIKLAEKIPVVGNGLNGDNVYLNSDGDLVIEFVNLENGEQAEIEITSSGIIAEVGI